MTLVFLGRPGVLVLRTQDNKHVINRRSFVSEDVFNEAKAELTRAMHVWEKSDQFIGRPLEVVLITEGTL